MNSVFGNLSDQHAALLHSTMLLNPGGKVVISHPLGEHHCLLPRPAHHFSLHQH
jgi:hypothetical protein